MKELNGIKRKIEMSLEFNNSELIHNSDFTSGG